MITSALFEEGSAKGESAIGLDHVAFKFGNRLDELREAKGRLEAAGVTPTPVDHEVTKSLYFTDPDGNGVELFADVSDVWRKANRKKVLRLMRGDNLLAQRMRLSSRRPVQQLRCARTPPSFTCAKRNSGNCEIHSKRTSLQNS